MYYSEEEAAKRLGIGVEELASYVRDDRLRIFQDGARRMFRADEVDALAPGGDEEIVDLEPTPTGAGDAVSLEQVERAAPPTKEDTVITAEGISIFDDEDLEIEAADPMAKTQIAPSIEDQIALEGVGSGSGLLDLTRESDDTSLGAEVLDHIDLETDGPPPPPGTVVAVTPPTPAVAEAPIVAPAYVEAIDAGAGLFGGIVVGCAIVAGLIGMVALGYATPEPPEYLEDLKEHLAVVLAAGFVLAIVAAVIGWFAGKASAARRRAMQQMGG
jgi:hypothetical protein